MDLKNSNYLFDPDSWIEARNKGKTRFVYIPVLVMLLITGFSSYFSIEQTKGDIFKSGILTLSVIFIIYISRLTTWYWKEYKYNRYINEITNYDKRDFAISVANLIRILANLIVLFLIIKFSFE